jgi:hypothetical protein
MVYLNASGLPFDFLAATLSEKNNTAHPQKAFAVSRGYVPDSNKERLQRNATF